MTPSIRCPDASVRRTTASRWAHAACLLIAVSAIWCTPSLGHAQGPEPGTPLEPHPGATSMFGSDSHAARPIVRASVRSVRPLWHAHAHNDYEHPRSLLDALAHGFTSVEADIHLVGDRLLVAHDLDEVTPERTLESLYLDPLLERVREHGGMVYPEADEDSASSGGKRSDPRPFILLVDIKSDGPETYLSLHRVLERYREMVVTVRDGVVEPGPVLVIVSGNRPIDLGSRQPVRYAAFDGRLDDLGSDAPRHLIPLISESWWSRFSWSGSGQIPSAERARLQRITETAHQQGRRVRFWATPESPQLWEELLQSGVDLINTDRLAELEAFLRRR